MSAGESTVSGVEPQMERGGLSEQASSLSGDPKDGDSAEKLAQKTRGRFLSHPPVHPWAKLSAILFVADFFHPLDNLAIKFFLDGDVRHSRGWRGAVPVLLAGRNPDDVTRANFFNRAAPALGPAATGRDDERLAERVCMPCCARARLEGYSRALDECRIGSLK